MRIVLVSIIFSCSTFAKTASKSPDFFSDYAREIAKASSQEDKLDVYMKMKSTLDAQARLKTPDPSFGKYDVILLSFCFQAIDRKTFKKEDCAAYEAGAPSACANPDDNPRELNAYLKIIQALCASP